MTGVTTTAAVSVKYERDIQKVMSVFIILKKARRNGMAEIDSVTLPQAISSLRISILCTVFQIIPTFELNIFTDLVNMSMCEVQKYLGSLRKTVRIFRIT